MSSSTKNKQKVKKISALEFDAKFERGQDISSYLDLDHVSVIKRVNVDFSSWMLDLLDREALKLNVSRQAIIKMWINDRLMSLLKTKDHAKVKSL